MDENERNCDVVDPDYVPVEPDKEDEDIQEEQEISERKRRRKFTIWEYFKRLPPASQKRARCSICLEVKSYRTSSTNLKSHLKLRHPKIMEQCLQQTRDNTSAEVDTTETVIDNSGPQCKPRWRDPTIWKYFKRAPPESEKIAQCNYCQQFRSYKTSITNLKTHLSLKHPEAVEGDQQFVRRILSGRSRQRKNYARNKRKMWEFLEIETDNDEYDAQNDTNETGNVKFSSEIWRHFDVEDEEAICGLCRETTPSSLVHMKNHLEDKHASVLDDIAQKVLDAASEDDVLGDDDLYTEVVYLEDEPKTIDEQSEKPKKTVKPKLPKVKTERHASTSSDELVRKPKHKSYETIREPDELGTFINYIAVLLKKVPKESSQKLHLDIINLIMNATQPQNKIVIETVNYSAANAILNESIILSQNGASTSDTSTLNTQRVLTVPVQSLIPHTDEIPQHDEKNTTSQVTASNTVL